MATTKTARKPAKRAENRSDHDAIDLLMQDHEAVSALFDEFEDAEDESEKQDLVEQICEELTIHATIEEEIFYPAVRREVDDAEDLLDEAKVEHETVKELVSQLEASAPGDDLFDAKVTVLAEYVKHHVKEEQNEMFPKAKKAGLDLAELGERLQQRKDELMAEQQQAH